MLKCQGLDERFPLRAADGLMTKAWLLSLPERGDGCSGSRTRLLLNPTGGLAEGFAPDLG
jgi:hypothetical protein